MQTGPHPDLRARCAAAKAVLDPGPVVASARSAALTGQTRIPVSHTKEASMAERHRCQIDLMIDEMVAAGKSEQDILTAIVAQYRPYDTLLDILPSIVGQLDAPSADAIDRAGVATDCHDRSKLSEVMRNLWFEPDLFPARVRLDRPSIVYPRFVILE
jgi:hypothetical protein